MLNYSTENNSWTIEEHLNILEEMGRRIACLRSLAGLTQSELAELVGVSEKCISYAECGKRELLSLNLLRIANVLGCSTDYLLKGTETPESGPIKF